jgi:hypothetical protein
VPEIARSWAWALIARRGFRADSSGFLLVNPMKSGDGFAVRICVGKLQSAFERADNILTQDMLDMFGVVMHMVRRDLCGMCEVQFPQTVISDDGTGAFPTCGSQGEAVVLDGCEVMTDKCPDIRLDFFKSSSPSFSQLAQGDAVSHEGVGLESVVDGFEGVFTSDTTATIGMFQPAGNDAHAWGEEEGGGKNGTGSEHDARARGEIRCKERKKGSKDSGYNSQCGTEENHAMKPVCEEKGGGGGGDEHGGDENDTDSLQGNHDGE